MIVVDKTTHEVRAITAPTGLDGGGQILCTCGWAKPYERLRAGLAKHAAHALYARLSTAMRGFA